MASDAALSAVYCQGDYCLPSSPRVARLPAPLQLPIILIGLVTAYDVEISGHHNLDTCSRGNNDTKFEYG